MYSIFPINSRRLRVAACFVLIASLAVTGVLLSGCSSDAGVQEPEQEQEMPEEQEGEGQEPQEEEQVPEEQPFVECTYHLGELGGKYREVNWNESSIRAFVTGRWRYHRVESQGHDSLIVNLVQFERDLHFRPDSIMDVYDPADTLLGTSRYEFVELETPGTLRRFEINQVTKINGSLYTHGVVVPCESELVFYKSERDGQDDFYRRVD